MFLTAEELVTLTGYRKPSAQIRWLRAHRYRYDVNGVGHPVVVREWIVGAKESTVFEPARQRPNLRALPGRG